MTAHSESPNGVEPHRIAVRLEDLERQSRVHPDDMVEEQAQPTLGAGAWDETRRQTELAGGA